MGHAIVYYVFILYMYINVLYVCIGVGSIIHFNLELLRLHW